MIPDSPFLERYYPHREVVALEALREALSGRPEKERDQIGREALRALWPDELTYISKTHFIRTKEAGRIVLLDPNYAQRRFHQDVITECRSQGMPIRGIILKARQLGFSTFIQSWNYEQCDREPFHSAVTLSYDVESTKELFGKAQFIRNRQYFPRDTSRKSTETLEFAEHGSMFYAITAGRKAVGRSYTYHHMHCSEIPMWDDAEESLGAAVQAVPSEPDTSIFYESTARGARGTFYDDWIKAERGENDFIPFFAPWFWDPKYSLEFPDPDSANAFGRSLNPTERRLQSEWNVTLEQLHWRRFKIRNDLQGSEAKFRQEYPSFPKEAFLTTGTPVFDADRIAELETNEARPIWIGDISLELS